MRIAIPLYDRFTALDAVGPYEVLSRLPGASVTWLAREPGVVRNDNGMLGIEAQAAFEDLPDPEIVLVPGGTGTNDVLDDERLVGWIRRAHETSEWTTSVCTGSLLLGAAGVLDGLEATSHWLDLADLERYGARPTGRRVVEQGKVITAAGVSSGIDMGLMLAAKIAGPEVAQAIQLGIEYDPQPPFDAGSVDKAPKEIVELVRSLAAARDAEAGLAHPDGGRARHRAVTHAVHAAPRQCNAVAAGAGGADARPRGASGSPPAALDAEHALPRRRLELARRARAAAARGPQLAGRAERARLAELATR